MKLIKQLRKKYSKEIKTLYFDLVLAYLIKKPREFLYSHLEYNLTLFEYLKFKIYLKKLSKGLPIAYITKTKEFFGLKFFVSKNVLIPRPETEIMVEEVLKQLCFHSKQTNCHSELVSESLACHPEQSEGSNITLIDVGTGSGCIPISIMTTLQHYNTATQNEIKYYAIDISKKALKVAKKNTKHHGINIKFLYGNLLEPILEHFNTTTPVPPRLMSRVTGQALQHCNKVIITANLPYVTEKQYSREKSIQHEPKLALTAKKSGLDLYEKLLKQIVLLPNNYSTLSIYFEIDPDQTEKIKVLIKKYLPKADTEIIKDLSGKNRIVKIILSN